MTDWWKLEGDVEEAKVMRVSGQQSPVLIMVGQKLLETVGCLSCVGSLITIDVRCTRDVKYSIAMAKTALSKKKALLTNRLDVNLRMKAINCYVWSRTLCGAETWTLRRVNQKYLGSFEMWC